MRHIVDNRGISENRCMEDGHNGYVLVRTLGGYPCLRRLVLFDPPACLVVEDEWFVLVEDGDSSWAVGVPVEDVFRVSPGLGIDPNQPYAGWRNLTPVA